MLYKTIAFLAIAAPAFAQYGGPAILSRGDMPAAMSGAETDFQPYLTVTGTYDTGLAGAATGSKGQLATGAAYGMRFSGGLSGTHTWEHTKVTVDYSGSFDRYTQKTFYSTTNQSFSVNVIHQIAPHITLNVKENAGTFSQNYATFGSPQSVLSDSPQSSIPVTDFVDNRTSYLVTQADLVYQKTFRLSFDVGGGAYVVRQSALYGTNGESARGDVQYRLAETTTIGAAYNYSNYDFTGILGTTNIHTFSGTFARRLSERWEVSGYGGVSREENKFEQAIPLQSEIASLLGVSSVVGIAYAKHYVPTGSVRLSRSFRKGLFYATGSRAITPGNGLFLVSNMTTGAVGYTYTGLRFWTFTSQAQYQRGESVGNVIGTYGDTMASVNLSRQITRSVHFIAGVDLRRYQSAVYSLYNRLVYDVNIGFGFTPSPIPVRMW